MRCPPHVTGITPDGEHEQCTICHEQWPLKGEQHMIQFSRDGIAHLQAEVRKGGGLWVGLHLQLKHPDHPQPPHVLLPWLPEDAHLTVLHLGRNRTVQAVESLVRAVEDISHRGLVPDVAEITGVGWFWRRQDPCLVALLNSARIFQLRAALVRELTEEHGIRIDDTFGFIPHVTLRSGNQPSISPSYLAGEMSRAPAIGVHLAPLAIVCREATIRPQWG